MATRYGRPSSSVGPLPGGGALASTPIVLPSPPAQPQVHQLPPSPSGRSAAAATSDSPLAAAAPHFSRASTRGRHRLSASGPGHNHNSLPILPDPRQIVHQHQLPKTSVDTCRDNYSVWVASSACCGKPGGFSNHSNSSSNLSGTSCSSSISSGSPGGASHWWFPIPTGDGFRAPHIRGWRVGPAHSCRGRRSSTAAVTAVAAAAVGGARSAGGPAALATFRIFRSSCCCTGSSMGSDTLVVGSSGARRGSGCRRGLSLPSAAAAAPAAETLPGGGWADGGAPEPRRRLQEHSTGRRPNELQGGGVDGGGVRSPARHEPRARPGGVLECAARREDGGAGGGGGHRRHVRATGNWVSAWAAGGGAGLNPNPDFGSEPSSGTDREGKAREKKIGPVGPTGVMHDDDDGEDVAYGRPRKRLTLGPSLAATLAKATAVRRRAATDLGVVQRDRAGGDGGGGERVALPDHPAKLTRAIKMCTTATELYGLYRAALAGGRGPAEEDDNHPVTAAATVVQHMDSASVSERWQSSAGGAAGVNCSSGGGGGLLNDLHMVTILTHLAQVVVAEPAAAAAGQRGRAGGGVAEAPAAAGVASFGWEVAMAVGVRLTAGSELMSQPRAASNALWAAAKLRLRLRAAWWEAMSAPLMAVAAADELPPPPTGRDLCNAIYALGVTAAGATEVGAGGRMVYDDVYDSSGEGRASNASRRFEGRLRCVGERLLAACSAERLRGCKAQELSSLLYGTALLRLQPSAVWLSECYSPALLDAMMQLPGSPRPQLVANVLWALQRMTADPPTPLATALLTTSRDMLQRTATAAPASAPTEIAAPRGWEDYGRQLVEPSRSPPPLTFRSHAVRQQQSPPPPSVDHPLASPPPLLPVMLGTVVWSVGRLASRGALRLDDDDDEELMREETTEGRRCGGGAAATDSWTEAAVGASARLLRRQLAAAGGPLQQGWRHGGTAAAAAAAAAPPLGPRTLSALASGLVMLRVAPAAAANGGSDDGDVWRLLYAAALRSCDQSGRAATVAATAAAAGGPSEHYRHHRWDPRDIYALLAAAVDSLDLSLDLLPAPPQQRPFGALYDTASSPSSSSSPWGGTARSGLQQGDGHPPPQPPLPQQQLQRPHPTQQNRPAEAAAAAVAVRPPAVLVDALLLQLLPYLAPMHGSDGGAAGGGNGGGGLRCSSEVLVGSIWALAKLRYLPSEEVMSTLLAAVRRVTSRLPPDTLAKLLWSLAALQRLRPDRSPADGVLARAAGLRRRVRHVLQRICAEAAAAAAAGDASPPLLPPRTLVQLLYSLRHLWSPLPSALSYRLAADIVRPAVRQLRREMQRSARRVGGRVGEGGPQRQMRLGRSPDVAKAAEVETGLYDSVRLLGAIASAMASLRSSGTAESPVASAALLASGCAASRSRGGLTRAAVTPVLAAAPAAPMDLRRSGLRLALWGAGWVAVRAAAAAASAAQPDGRRPPALTDWCRYLRGVRRLGFRPPPDLAAALVEVLAGREHLGQLEGCSSRDVVALACELSYLVGPSPPPRSPTAPGGAATAAAQLTYRRTGLAPRARRPRVVVLRGSVRRAAVPSPREAESYILSAGKAEEPPQVSGTTATHGPERPSDAVEGPGRGSGGGGGRCRWQRRRMAWLVRSKLVPAILRTALRAGLAANAAEAPEGAAKAADGGDGVQAGTSDLPYAEWRQRRQQGVLPEREAATLLRALRRLRLRPPPAVLFSLLRAAAAAATAAAADNVGGGVRALPPSLADTVRMAAAVAAVMPELPPAGPYSLTSAEAGRQAVAPTAVTGSPAAAAVVAIAETDAAAVTAATEWLVHVAATAEANLTAATPEALPAALLPLVAGLLAAARRAGWMRPTVQDRVLPATFAACARALGGGGLVPLPYISRLLDGLLPLTVTTSSFDPDSGRRRGQRPLLRRRDAYRGAGKLAAAPSLLPSAVMQVPAASSSPAAASALATPAPEPLDVRLPDELWLAVYRASYRQVAAAMPHAAAAAAAAVAAAAEDASPSQELSAASAAVLLTPLERFHDTVRPSGHSTNAVLYGGGGGGDGRGARGAGTSGAAVPLAASAAAPVSGQQVVALSYSLARHPPPRPPPDRWMRLMLLAVESDLGSLGARECADLCVALVRLGCVPGDGWLDRFGVQVELIRALTEKTEHSLLISAWLGLRQLRDHKQQQERQQELQQQQQQG